ncbi:glycosyl hydrolase family 115 (putative glucuronidase) [Paenibacillus sp. BK033]|uniref:glycosyl hydrolase 115 family protein n=1 Tax=Paenibacillus sp. BK033 TaxID=2512133 RepID=UPI0010468F9A|nr:glycosyl hydrolase 115 family protein [Paenibacillus sp. BK033]TCM97068.1 glycosyl hydrolase family 115 (putative glucuronidase) [Paenibacillus sp. BK033]
MLNDNYISFSYHEGHFPLSLDGKAADIYVSGQDYAGVIRAVSDLQKDIYKVTQTKPQIIHQAEDLKSITVIIGTIGHSALIDTLIAEGKLEAADLTGKWESFALQTVANPLPDVDEALVVAGSDKRGTIYGIYDICERIGISPWYYWADVPVRKRTALMFRNGLYKQGEPSVKYRGIFLNDEGPSLMAWVRENFGDFNHKFYENVFELLLRLKANYLWPAMWDNTFYEDDELNPAVADMFGIVISTSHHEPMQRPHGDWKKHKQGPWDYSVNEEVLCKFWEEGIRRSASYENVISLGMRGDGDEAMGGQLSFREKIELLQRIVQDQRRIIGQQMKTDPAEVPQLWALYKEVQDYYENGMRVPDDITLLWSDDNHGNLRRVPTEEERSRSGGAGIYYHLDYVGGPRSYKWVNTVPLEKIWEQMHKAYEYGANRIWILNVGDLKPVECQLEFFLRMAWNMDEWSKDNIRDYSIRWAEQQFGSIYAEEAALIINRYSKWNGRLKPELLNAVPLYSSVHYKEADNLLTELHDTVKLAEQVHQDIHAAAKDAFFQTVLYPAKASAQVLEMHIRVARSKLYAAQGRASANVEAKLAKQLFEADAALSYAYNHEIADGKWNHMMDQLHIGYTYWNQPEEHLMPEVGTVKLTSENSGLGVAVEGSELAWPRDPQLPALSFDTYTRESRYIDLFNRGTDAFTFCARADQPWIKLSRTTGCVEVEERLWIEIDWNEVPQSDKLTGSITLIDLLTSKAFTVMIHLMNPASPSREALTGFMETNGYISIEAEHYSASNEAGGASWQVIPNYGRTLSSMAVFPVTVPSVAAPAPGESPCLEYKVYLTTPGELTVYALIAPTIDFIPGQGLRLGVSFDDHPIQVASAIGLTKDGGYSESDWEQSVILNIRSVATKHTIPETGYHTLKIWMVDPIVVLQKIMIDTGGLKPSYLGPPESYRGNLS